MDTSALYNWSRVQLKNGLLCQLRFMTVMVLIIISLLEILKCFSLLHTVCVVFPSLVV